MRTEQGSIDWARTEERARSLSDKELFYALVDISKTLESADALDRENGTDNGGYYRDEASIYHKEIARRKTL